jgi:hypothetical protein
MAASVSAAVALEHPPQVQIHDDANGQCKMITFFSSYGCPFSSAIAILSHRQWLRTSSNLDAWLMLMVHKWDHC